MRPRFRLRLKTKLVLAITGMVVAVVAIMSTIYVSQTLRHSVEDTYHSADFVGRQIFHVAKDAIEQELARHPGEPLTSERLAEVLQADPSLNSLLQSVVGYSFTIYDAAIVDTSGVALAHTDDLMLGEHLPSRNDFNVVREGGFGDHLRSVYEPLRLYDIRVPLLLDEEPFLEVRVGVSTTFLKREMEPQLNRAVVFSGLAVVASLLLAAGLSNFALRPLEQIARRLDRITAGEVDPAGEEARPPRSDEYGVVSTKIDRLGREMRDVKEVFSALKENLDQIMANLQDGLMLFTHEWQAVLVSASAEQFVGRDRSQMLGRHVHDIFSAGNRLDQRVLQAFDLHEPLDQVEVETESGRRVQLSLDFIEERGQRIGALITMRDAESVRRIEDEIELSRRLAAIGRLTSGVAHEVKNPINAIVVHLEVLRQKLQQVDPDTRRHMDVIGSEIQRLDRVVQTLVDFTRPVELRLSEFDLRRLLEDVLLLGGPEMERQGVNIVRHFPEEPSLVKVDADLVKQALLNVVLNGVQAMPNGGTLTLSVSRHNEDAMVEITDEGGGIPPEVRDKIFNLYFTTKKSGSGIGLAMTYRVMQLHNGSVECDSRQGQGTTFRLRLPLHEPQRVREQVAQA
jgi:PAS domain S-box-containing protein